MKGQLAVDAAEGGDRFQGEVDRAVAVHRQQLVLRRDAVVLIQNPNWQVEQRYLEPDAGLLAGRTETHPALRGPFQIGGRQTAHIHIGDARIAGEEKQVADKMQARRRKRRSHQPVQLLAGQVSLLATRALRFVFGERVGRDDSRGDRLADDRFQTRHEQNDRRRSQALLRTQIQIESFDQRPVQSPER